MSNPATLKPFSEWDAEEHRLVCRKGGVASGKVRREKRESKRRGKHGFEIQVETILAMKGGLRQVLKDMEGEEIIIDKDGRKWTMAEAVATVIIERCLDGNIRMIKLLLEILYGKPGVCQPEPVDKEIVIRWARDDEELEQWK